MRALFWDIDGVLQPLGRQNRFKHLEEIPGLCREPNRILDNGFDCVAYIEEYGSNVYDVAAAYAGFYRCKNRPVKRLARRCMERMRGMPGIHHLDTCLADATYFVSLEHPSGLRSFKPGVRNTPIPTSRGR